MSKFYSTIEAAKMLGVSRQTMLRHLDRYQGCYLRVGNKFMWHKETLDKWILDELKKPQEPSKLYLGRM